MPRDDHGRVQQTLDENLRQPVADGEAEPISVIVELDLPRARVKMDGEGSYGPSPIFQRPQRVVPAEDGETEQIRKEMEEFLEKVADETPVWLALSKAFVVDTTTDQLENIASFPRVRRISRNNRRRP